MSGADEVGLRTERHGASLVLQIDRPEVRNAVSPAVAAAIDVALDRAEADDSVRAVVITGSGDRAFCAGMDLRAAAREGTAGFAPSGHGFAGITARRFAKPLLAAVNGDAVGGGFEIVLACDVVVSVAHARFALPEVSRGLLAGGGGLIRIGKHLPRAAALDLALTARPISAARAYELGIVTELVTEHALERALQLADRIAANAPVAVRLSKRLVDESRDLAWREAWERNDTYVREIHRTEDAREGPRAFAEKRAPHWTGR